VKRRESGLTLVETLVAIVMFAVLSLIPLALFIPASQSDNNARQRTLALRAAETWLDRYRANQEPKVAAGSVCTVSGSTVTCAYPYKYTYPTSDFSTHDAQLAIIMSPFRHVVTSTILAGGTNVSEWQITAQTFWKQGTSEKSVSLTTRVAY
jgi:type II secretory pathway pseudopilin PulG